MKVLLEMIEDAANVLENLDDVGDLRPRSRKKLRDLLRTVSEESARLLRKVDSDQEGEGAGKRRGRRDAVLERGLAALARDRLEEAQTILEEGVEEFPEDVEMLNHLGLTCWERQKVEQAEEWYARAMEAGLAGIGRSGGNACRKPSRGYYRAVEGRALCLYRLGESERAVSLFDALGRMAPEDYAGCHYLAGEILHAEGRLDEAVDAYERSPDEPAVHYNLGLARFQQGNREEAATMLVRGFSANPHIAARLLEESLDSLSGPGGYLGSATYAEEFLEASAQIWAGCDGALDFLETCFEDPLVRHHLEEVGLQSEERERPEGGRLPASERHTETGDEAAGIAREILDRTDQ